MFCHGVCNLVEDHGTLWYVTIVDDSHSTVRFKYLEPISHHNQAMHLVDNTNNQSHDPISLSAVLRTKWWLTRQFTFVLEVAVANAANARGQARKKEEEPHLDFHLGLLKNANQQSLQWWEDSSTSWVTFYSRIIANGENGAYIGETGAWDENNGDWELVKSKYQKNTLPLLDSKIITGLFVHVIRKSPCVREVTVTIIHWTQDPPT